MAKIGKLALVTEDAKLSKMASKHARTKSTKDLIS